MVKGPPTAVKNRWHPLLRIPISNDSLSMRSQRDVLSHHEHHGLQGVAEAGVNPPNTQLTCPNTLAGHNCG